MKKIVRIMVILAVTICFSSCKSDVEIAKIEKLQADILGCWTSTSDEYVKTDDNDNLIEFSCYEFKENEILFHILSVEETKTVSICDEYEISSENEVVLTVGEEKYKAEILVLENGELIWQNGSGDDVETFTLRRLNDTEKTEFYIPNEIIE